MISTPHRQTATLLIEEAVAAGELEKQHPTVAEHHQIGKAGMDAHSDKDRLALGTARAGLGHLVGAVMHDGRLRQVEVTEAMPKVRPWKAARASP